MEIAIRRCYNGCEGKHLLDQNRLPCDHSHADVTINFSDEHDETTTSLAVDTANSNCRASRIGEGVTSGLRSCALTGNAMVTLPTTTTSEDVGDVLAC